MHILKAYRLAQVVFVISALYFPLLPRAEENHLEGTTVDPWELQEEIRKEEEEMLTLPSNFYAIEPRALDTALREIQLEILNDSISLDKFRENSDIAQTDATTPESQIKPGTILVNFNNVSIIEYLRFISRISNKNFIFDEADLQFNVTIVSEEPTSIENIMTALIQELRIHDITLVEEGNSFILHKNRNVSGISKVIAGELTQETIGTSEIITKVFKLNTVDPEKAAVILRPLVSSVSIIEILKDTGHIIITDIASNIIKISDLLKSLDSPASGLVIGEYTSKLFPIDNLIELSTKIMQPISLELPLVMVPQSSRNRIFIISTPYLVDKAISVLESLDQEQAILGPQKTPTGKWILGPDGKWYFQLDSLLQGLNEPEGSWVQDENGNWHFVPGDKGGREGPLGKWGVDANGNWIFSLDKAGSINPRKLSREYTGGAALPGGEKKITKFFIQKLLYRKGDEIERALQRISVALQSDEKNNVDTIAALGSLQWVEANNSLIITGTPAALEKVRYLIEDLDIPLRQVFIEMLILDTTVTDSLQYGVTYGTRFGGGDTSGAQAFISGSTPIATVLAATGLTGGGLPQAQVLPFIPNPGLLALQNGFSLGVIGQKITHGGVEFSSIAALIRAVHDRADIEIVANPKVISEDNATAEIFVGINTAFKTQAISNDLGSIVTNNFEYRDIGTRLKVTPYLDQSNMITLDIAQEISNVVSGLTTSGTSNTNVNTSNVGPTTSKNNITTRVHVPDGYFLIIGGLMQNTLTRDREQVPCLGGVPVLGALLSNKTNSDTKRNTLIFMRPILVDSQEEIDHLTKHQQDVWKQRQYLRNSFNYEVEEGLDWFNVKRTLYSDRECDAEIWE